MKFIQQEIINFIGAILYFTQIPIKIDYKKINFNHSIFYSPFVGLLIGTLSILFFLFISLITQDVEISIVGLMIFNILLTGALHEDGLSDFFDGFGGGYEKNKILEIMKDPRIGNFGALSLILSILLKFVILKKIYLYSSFLFMFIFIYMQFLSRWIILFFMKYLPYAREQGKAFIFNNISNLRFWLFQCLYFIFLIVSLTVLMYFFHKFLFHLIFIHLLFLLLLYLLLYRYLQKKIQGYTGDTLGATEQFSEIIVLFLTSIFIRFNM